jgi:addiction module HigA family antidote
MAMKNPAHPGEVIQNNIDELGLSVTEAAKGLGVTRQQLHKVITGRSSITPEMAVRLEMAIGTTANTWLHMQMNYHLAQTHKHAGSIKLKRLEPKVA